MLTRVLSIFLLFSTAAWSGQYSRHIEKAIAYLNARQGDIKFDTLIGLELLQRNFGITLNVAKARERLLKKSPRKYRPYLRIFDKEAKLSDLEVSALRGWTGFVAKVTHCDLYPLPWDFFLTLRKYTSQHESNVLQEILVLTLLDWMRCDVDRQTLQSERQILAEKVRGLLAGSTVGSFLWANAVLGLFQAGRFDWVRREDLDTLARQQLRNGSWQNDDLYTSKALAILLWADEMGNPGKKEQRPARPLIDNYPSTS